MKIGGFAVILSKWGGWQSVQISWSQLTKTLIENQHYFYDREVSAAQAHPGCATIENRQNKIIKKIEIFQDPLTGIRVAPS